MRLCADSPMDKPPLGLQALPAARSVSGAGTGACAGPGAGDSPTLNLQLNLPLQLPPLQQQFSFSLPFQLREFFLASLLRGIYQPAGPLITTPGSGAGPGAASSLPLAAPKPVSPATTTLSRDESAESSSSSGTTAPPTGPTTGPPPGPGPAYRYPAYHGGPPPPAYYNPYQPPHQYYPTQYQDFCYPAPYYHHRSVYPARRYPPGYYSADSYSSPGPSSLPPSAPAPGQMVVPAGSAAPGGPPHGAPPLEYPPQNAPPPSSQPPLVEPYAHYPAYPAPDAATYRCPCPMQSCPKNVHTGPLTGDGKGPKHEMQPQAVPLPPVALALPLEPPPLGGTLGPPSPARGSAGMPPPWDSAIPVKQDPGATSPCGTPCGSSCGTPCRTPCGAGCGAAAGLLAISKQFPSVGAARRKRERPVKSAPSPAKAAVPINNNSCATNNNNVKVETKEEVKCELRIVTPLSDEPPQPDGDESKRKVEDEAEQQSPPKKKKSGGSKRKSDSTVACGKLPSTTTSSSTTKAKKGSSEEEETKRAASRKSQATRSKGPIAVEQGKKKGGKGPTLALTPAPEPAPLPRDRKGRESRSPKPKSKSRSRSGGSSRSRSGSTRSQQEEEEAAAAAVIAAAELPEGVPLNQCRKLIAAQKKLISKCQAKKAREAARLARLEALRASKLAAAAASSVLEPEPKPGPGPTPGLGLGPGLTSGLPPAAAPSISIPVAVPDKPAADKPAADKPAADKPAADKPCADGPPSADPAAVTELASKAGVLISSCLKITEAEMRLLASCATAKTPKWSNGWEWRGQPFMHRVFLNCDDPPVLRKCYPGMQHVEGDSITLGDTILLKSGTRKIDLPFVARVIHLWESPDDGEMMLSLVWFYRPEHTEQGRRPCDREDEIFSSRHKDINSVACIEDKCYVLTFNEYCRYRKTIRRLEEGLSPPPLVVPGPDEKYPRHHRLPPGHVAPDMVFFCRRIYDFRQKRLQKNVP